MLGVSWLALQMRSMVQQRQAAGVKHSSDCADRTRISTELHPEASLAAVFACC